MLARTVDSKLAAFARVRPLSAAAARSIERSKDFAKLDDSDLRVFRSILGSDNPNDMVVEPADLERYNQDWTRKYVGESKVALRPSSVEQVSAILRYCQDRRLAIVPQGGNTGLVGGSVPVFDEIVVSLEKMNRILAHDPVSGVLRAEAGVVLETADRYLAQRGFMMPLDLGAKGSCMLGGNVATNAGGLRLLRFGSLRGTVLGLQAVLPDGRVVGGEQLSGNRKDNTGYDLKQLFIGSEGTLGIVTAVSILTPPLPSSVNVLLFAVNDFAAIGKVFAKARTSLGEILSAFEFWDSQSQRLLEKHFPQLRLPIGGSGNFYVLVETMGSDSTHDSEKGVQFMEGLQNEDMVVDGTMAQDSTQCRAIWSLRESIPEACSREGIVYKYDLSLPSSQMYSLVEQLRGRLAHLPTVKQTIGYGHFGDGNIHLNISTAQHDPTIVARIEPFVYEYIRSKGGSISAEHGIGTMKASALGYSKSPTELSLLRQIKQIFDPCGILNPYKILLQH